MNAHGHNPSMENEATLLQESLRRLKYRGQVLTLIGGVAWTASGAIALLIALVATLGWFGGDALRAVGWGLLGVVTSVLLAGVLVRPLLRLRREGAVARHIGTAYPALASDVLSADQLATGVSDERFSKELLTNHLKRVTESLLAIPASRIFPTRPLLLPSMALAAVLAFGVTASNMWERTASTGLASLWRDGAPPKASPVQEAALAPILGDLELSLKYPEYLERADRQLLGISGGLVAPSGTTVIVAGSSLVEDASRGYIELPGGGTAPLSVGEDGRVFGRFVVREKGEFSFVLGTHARMLKGPKRVLEMEPDAAPSIRLLRPVGRVEVAEDGEVILELEAEDDHGIRSIDLVLRAGNDLELRKTIIHLADKVRRLKTQYRWTPESVRVDTTVDLRLELEAFDNDTIQGPKAGHTDPISIRILTPERRHKNIVTDQNEVLGALVDLLAKRLETRVPSNKRPGEVMERFNALRLETEDSLGKLAHLIRALNLDGMSPKRVADAFVQMRQDISDKLFAETSLHQGGPSDYRRRAAADKLTVRTVEDAIIRVDDLIIEQQLSRIVRTGSGLEGQHAELEPLLKRFAETRSETARRALLDGIDRMEEVFRKLEEEVGVVSSRVGDTFVAREARIGLDLMGSLDKLRSLLAEGDLLEATRLIRSLDNDVSRLMAALEGGLLSFRTDRFGEDDRFIGELLDKLMTIEASQLQLRRETTAVTRRAQERLVEVMRGRIDPIVKKQLVRARRMGKIIKGIESPGGEGDRLRLVRLRILSQELRLVLGQGDLEEARLVATEAEEIASEWLGGANSPSRNAVKEIRRTAGEMVREVEGAFPVPNQLLSDRDRRLTRNYSFKQRALVTKSRRLKMWAAGQKSSMRFISNRASHALGTVSDHMRLAITSLEEKRVRDTLVHQTEALDALARLREDLKRGGEVAPLKSRAVVLQGRVEIPDPDDYEVPPEFRDEILKAMESDLPAQYQAAIKKYYETLVE